MKNENGVKMLYKAYSILNNTSQTREKNLPEWFIHMISWQVWASTNGILQKINIDGYFINGPITVTPTQAYFCDK